MGHRSRKEHVCFSSSLRAGSMLLHPSHGLQNVKNCFNLWSCQSVTPTGAEVLGTSSISLLGIAIGGRRAFAGCCWGQGSRGRFSRTHPRKAWETGERGDRFGRTLQPRTDDSHQAPWERGSSSEGRRGSQLGQKTRFCSGPFATTCASPLPLLHNKDHTCLSG